MPKIENFVEIKAPKDKVWKIISDLDNEAEYWWGTKEVRNISKEGNTINREITQNFRNHKISQKVILRPEDEIEIQYLKGLTEGVKMLKLESMGDNSQKLTSTWNVHFPGIYVLLTWWIAGHVKKGNIDALDRIKKAAEA
jgi:hypothetical protein